MLLKDVIERDFRNLWIIGVTLIGWSGVMLSPSGVGRQTRGREGHDACAHVVVVGAVQALALVPGVSRSGATIRHGRLLGYDREAATRLRFLLAIPALVGAGLFELKDIPGGDTTASGRRIVATVVCFVVGYAAIAWLLRYVAGKSYRQVRALPRRARPRADRRPRRRVGAADLRSARWLRCRER